MDRSDERKRLKRHTGSDAFKYWGSSHRVIEKKEVAPELRLPPVRIICEAKEC